MQRTDFKTQFLIQLNNVELPLDERLHIAHGAIISQEFPLPGKEQVIIDWFAHCLKVNSRHPKGILKKLMKCLKSDWLLTFCDAVDASKLIEVCIELDEDIKYRYSKLLVKLVLLLLKMPSFQRYCRFDILPMTQATGMACDLLSHTDGSGVCLDDSTATESDEDLVTAGLEDLFNSILNIHKVTQQRDELKLRFVKIILPAILNLRFNFKNSTHFHILLEELIIGEDTNALCIAFKYYGKNESRHIPEYLKAIVKYIAQDDTQCDVITLNSVIFDVYVHTCLKLNETTTNHLTLFYILAIKAGFKLQLPYEVPIACNGSGPTLLVLSELVAVLQKYNISASTESEEGVLSNYLIAILKQLICEEYQLSSDLLRTVYGIFQVYPESVKLVFFEFAKHVMFVSKENSEVFNVYNTLVEEVIKIYADLNQIEKFLSSFFHKAFLLQEEHDFRKLTCGTVLSNGIFKVFSEKLPSLTGNQLKAIIGRLEKIFLKNCIYVLESDKAIDSSFCLNVEMLVKVICFVLDNSCIVMPTRWNTLSEEMSRLVLSVQRFGVAVLKYREIELLKGFLDLVRATAGIEMMMNQYVISLSSTKLLPTVKSVDKSGSLFNLARSHGYLSPPDWKRISELMVEFDDQQLKYSWYNLLLQKYFRCGDLDVMTHLVLNAGSVWLWEKVEYLSVGVPQKHLELYIDQLISTESLTADQFVDRLATLGNVNVLKNRAFRVTMSLQVLNNISKLIPDKSALSRNMMKLIDIQSVVNNEVGEGSRVVDTIVDAVAEVMNKCPWDDQPLVVNGEVKEHLIKLMDLLTVMRTYGLNIETKQIIFLVLVGIAYDLRSQDGVLHSTLQHILGLLDDGDSLVADSVDRRVLVNWLALVVPHDYTARRQLAQLMVQKVVSTLDRCIDSMTSVLQTDTDVLYALLDTLTQVNESKTLKNKEEFPKLVKQLISLVSSVVLKKPKANFLTVYTTALKAEYVYFKEKQPTLLQNLTDYLEILYKKLDEQWLVESNVTELIVFTLSAKERVDPEIINNLNRVLTNELCKVNPCPIVYYPSTVKHFLESLTTDSFEDLLLKIYKNQHKSLTSEDGSCTVSNVCVKWNVILSAQVDKDKLLLRHKMVARVLSDCLPLLEQDTALVEPVVLQLLHSISVSKSVILASKLLDHILVIVGLAPTDSGAHLLPHALAVLGALLHSQSEIVYDRIPAFLQRLRKLLRSLVLVATADSVDSVAYNSGVTDSINQFSRIIKSMIDQHSKHFARIAPYLIADVLQLLSTHSIHPSVKEELRNSVCSLLTICDGYGNQLLQNLLSLGATELYKVISSTFRRSYKYTGKV